MSRNAEQNQMMRDRSRRQILSSALRLFSSRGLIATKTGDIAAASGISQGLIYHYFRSKEAIFTELIRGAFERMNAAALALEALPLSPREKIAKAIETMLRSMEKHEDYARYFLLIAQASYSEAIPDEAKAVIRKDSSLPYEVVTRIMRAGQRDGSIKKYAAQELALVFWTSIKGLALHRVTHGVRFKAPDVRILTSLFFTEE